MQEDECYACDSKHNESKVCPECEHVHSERFPDYCIIYCEECNDYHSDYAGR